MYYKGPGGVWFECDDRTVKRLESFSLTTRNAVLIGYSRIDFEEPLMPFIDEAVVSEFMQATADADARDRERRRNREPEEESDDEDAALAFRLYEQQFDDYFASKRDDTANTVSDAEIAQAIQDELFSSTETPRDEAQKKPRVAGPYDPTPEKIGTRRNHLSGEPLVKAQRIRKSSSGAAVGQKFVDIGRGIRVLNPFYSHTPTEYPPLPRLGAPAVPEAAAMMPILDPVPIGWDDPPPVEYSDPKGSESTSGGVENIDESPTMAIEKSDESSVKELPNQGRWIIKEDKILLEGRAKEYSCEFILENFLTETQALNILVTDCPPLSHRASLLIMCHTC